MTYTVDSRDLLRAGRDAEARGDEIVGVLAQPHAHRRLPVADRRAAGRSIPTWIYVIVSLRDQPMLRAYRIRDGAIAEIPVVLDRVDPPGHG